MLIDYPLLAEYLIPPLTRQAVICPACLGGQSKERSFRLAEYPGRIVGSCFRASCGWRYFGNGDIEDTGPAAPVTNPYIGALSALGRADRDFFFGRYGNPDHAQQTDDGHYALPVRDVNHVETGVVIRRPPPDAPLAQYRTYGTLPKARTHRAVDAPLLAWYGQGHYVEPGPTALLVEDQLSAIRASWFGNVTAVALLGTQLTRDKVSLLQRSVQHIVLALDADASALAFQHARDWGHAFKSFRVLVLKEDLKDAPLRDFVEALDGVFRGT